VGERIKKKKRKRKWGINSAMLSLHDRREEREKKRKWPGKHFHIEKRERKSEKKTVFEP